MLTHLAIENYALIDHLDIGFLKGFSAITGETGAGKSILVDAFDLVLGKRADSQFLLDPAKKCVVEASFAIGNYNIRHFFDESGLDYDDLTIMRREVHPNGKSRAFINDTPVTLNQLKVLGDLLIDIHAQHATTSLQDPDFQLSVIDSYAGLETELTDYQQQFLELKKTRELLQTLINKEKTARASLDYKQFLLDELNDAAILHDEQDQLEEKLTLVTHAEEIKSTLFQVQGSLNDEETSILNLITLAESNLRRISSYHPGLEQFAERIKSDLIDLKDVHLELTRLNESIDYNQEAMATIQQRLDLLYRLQHKHHVNSNRELIEISEKLNLELTEYSSLEDHIKDIEKQVITRESGLETCASLLSERRKAAFSALQKEIITSLKHMGIPEARFEVRSVPLPACGIVGKDKIEFYFNANMGHSLKPLSETASGGELSRVMLSIKSIISNKKQLPTIIFDEIDNGLSGDVAGRVGDVLHSAAARMQVIAVTHLPQIAGKAQQHYSVFKQNKNNVTFSNIKFLDRQERVAELAKMIGGREITEASLAAAKELLTSIPEIH